MDPEDAGPPREDGCCPLTGEVFEECGAVEPEPRWIVGEDPSGPETGPGVDELKWDRVLEDDCLDWSLAGACALLAPLPQPERPPLGKELTGPCGRMMLNFQSACGPGRGGSPGLNAATAAEWLIRKAFWPGAGGEAGDCVQGAPGLPPIPVRSCMPER